MKKIQYLLVLIVAAFVATSCADSYLNQEPGGSSITEDQYNRMDNKVEGLVKGVLPNFYSHFGDDHASFGQRAIDMYGVNSAHVCYDVRAGSVRADTGVICFGSSVTYSSDDKGMSWRKNVKISSNLWKDSGNCR